MLRLGRPTRNSVTQKQQSPGILVAGSQRLRSGLRIGRSGEFNSQRVAITGSCRLVRGWRQHESMAAWSQWIAARNRSVGHHRSRCCPPLTLIGVVLKRPRRSG